MRLARRIGPTGRCDPSNHTPELTRVRGSVLNVPPCGCQASRLMTKASVLMTPLLPNPPVAVLVAVCLLLAAACRASSQRELTHMSSGTPAAHISQPRHGWDYRWVAVGTPAPPAPRAVWISPVSLRPSKEHCRTRRLILPSRCPRHIRRCGSYTRLWREITNLHPQVFL